MDDEKKTTNAAEESDKRLVHNHASVALSGDKDKPPLAHQIEGHVSHGTVPTQPLVHMVCWESEQSCHVDLAGQVVLAGNEKAPLPVRVTHYFDDPRCKLEVGPLTHKLEVEPLSHRIEVGPLYHKVEVAPLSHKVEVEPLSHKVEVAPLNHRVQVEPLSHTLDVDPLSHTLDISTALAMPIHHALQMRTPLQVRFCNTWHVASDYVVDIKMGDRSLFSIHLTGATVATPQPCPEEEPCPPPIAHPGHP